MPKIREDNAFFWQLFVAGAPYNLSQNINGELALVNGAPVTGHSLTFGNLSEFERVTNLLDGSDAPPFGSEIAVEEPTSVNMVVEPSLDGKPLSTTRKAQLQILKQFSIVQGDSIVIPVTCSMASSSKSDYNRFSYPMGNLLSPVAIAEVWGNFSF
jgi:hypothetical protein